MKKALYVATVDIHIKTFHLPYLKLLHEMGYEVHVATNGIEQFPYCDKKFTIPIKRSPYSLKNFKAIKELKNIIDTENYDIIHCHTPMGSVVTRLAAKQARKNGTRVIYTAHGFHFYKGAPLINWMLFYPIEWYLAKYTDTIITINTEDYELAKNKFNKRCKDIQYIPGVGIDTKKFDIEANEKEKLRLRKTLGLKKNDFILICVARLDKNKNQGFLINVMKKLVIEYNNIHLLLVGPDEINGKYQEKVKEYKLENNVHFLGRRDDIPKLLSISDIVVSASKREGLPVNIIEAFATGKPVIALNCRGVDELIENGKNGYIIKNNKCQSDYIEKIIYIYNLYFNKKILKYTKNNKKKADFFDIDNLIEKYKNIY